MSSRIQFACDICEREMGKDETMYTLSITTGNKSLSTYRNPRFGQSGVIYHDSIPLNYTIPKEIEMCLSCKNRLPEVQSADLMIAEWRKKINGFDSE